jgi:carbonic anhydrase
MHMFCHLESFQIVLRKLYGEFTPIAASSLVHSPELLSKYFGVAQAELDAMAITDPHKAVAVDVAALKANPLPGGLLVTGLVYDVTTGRVEILVPPALLRPESHA